MKILEVKGLTKNYNDLQAVRGIDFSINQGEFVALLGPNGAGKSTTINILCTLLRQTSGDVLYGDSKIGQDDDVIRNDIGIVFQDNVLDNNLTVEENLLTRGILYINNRKELKEKVQDIISTLQIGDIAKQRYGTLSGGQRRRVDIARALLHSPKILFLDEPTTGLDPSTRKLVWNTMKHLREKGLTIVLTTHYMEETIDCDRVIIMNKGEILCQDSPEQLRMKYSKDVLKVIGNLEGIKRQLTDYEYNAFHDYIEIEVQDSLQADQLLQVIKSDVIAFEVLRGNMDDVFLNLTGTRLN